MSNNTAPTPNFFAGLPLLGKILIILLFLAVFGLFTSILILQGSADPSQLQTLWFFTALTGFLLIFILLFENPKFSKMSSQIFPTQLLITEIFWMGRSLTLLLFSVFLGLFILSVKLQGAANPALSNILNLLTVVTGFLWLFVQLVQLTYANNWLGEPIVLPPPTTAGKTVGLIFIQGEGIPIERYEPVGVAIQAAATDLQLWVGIPKFIGNSPIPRETGLVIDQAIAALKQAGMPPEQDLAGLFFIAHSAGGIAIQKYLQSFPHRANGQILTGSFLEKSYLSGLTETGQTLISYNVPTLTIGGTLDGLARITRIAAAFWYQQLNAAMSGDRDRFPVLAIEGATHMQFASGEATSYVAAFDLKPQIPETETHQQVAQLAYHFICTQLPDDDAQASRDFLAQQRDQSQQCLQPLLDALQLEGYNGFKPACYARAEDNPRNVPSCTPYSPWVQNDANSIMAGADASPVPFTVAAIDSFHRSYTTDPFHEPSVHIPQIRNSCSGDESACQLVVSSVSQALYDLLDALDTGFFPIAAFSLRTKLNSRQNFWAHAGVSDPDFKTTDGHSRGAEINQAAYAWALDHAAATAKTYFEEQGVPLVMGDDFQCLIKAGPFWIWNYPKFKYIDQYRACQVRSTVMKTPINYPIRSASGFHYCQLLSPAAAMEWIYIDGLRRNASLKPPHQSNLVTYGLIGELSDVLRYFVRTLLRQLRLKGLFAGL
ncbi:MAG: alpha/beta hydrolase [Spirulinaceae cyanobacterium]